MKQKSPEIQQGVVTELMTELANLPEREKDPGEPVSLSEIFRTKEYAAEVKAALKKGYTFEHLAEIFTNRCGIVVSARQIKYHFTRGKNRGMKSKSRTKAERVSVTGSHVSSVDSAQASTGSDRKETVMPSDSSATNSSKGERFSSGNGVVIDAKAGTFSFDVAPKESLKVR
jgi:hypothetical protein